MKGFQNGSKPYQQRAKRALPFLVARARTWGTFTYGQLAELVSMPNPRNLNYVLGAIGTELKALGRAWKEEVPPIECIVINKNDKTPRRGIGFHMPVEKFRKLTPAAKKQVLNALNLQIWSYPKWDTVLKHFNLPPVAVDQQLVDLASRASRYGNAGGEGADHRLLKEYLACNLHRLGLPTTTPCLEHRFPSGDAIDVLLKYPKEWVGIEVKGASSDEVDLMRGIFQCIKYQALIEAEQKLNQQTVGGRLILALGGKLPSAIRELADLFEIKVIERISVPANFTGLKKAATAGQ